MEGTEDSTALILPGAEEIYDLELSDLEELQHTIDTLLEKRHYNPQYQTFEKFVRKANKLRSLVELELSERLEVDGLLKFFLEAPEDPAGAKAEEDAKSKEKSSPAINSLYRANPFLRNEEDKVSDTSSELSNTEHTRKTSTSTSYSKSGKPPPQRGYLAKQMGNQGKLGKKALHDFMREKLAATRVDTGMVMVVGKTSVQNPVRCKNAAASLEKGKRPTSRSRAISQKEAGKGAKSSSSKSEVKKNKQGTRVKKEAKKPESKKSNKTKGVTETASTQALDESKSGMHTSNTEAQSETGENSILDQKQLADVEDASKDESLIDSVAIEVNIKPAINEICSKEGKNANNAQGLNEQELTTNKDTDKKENKGEGEKKDKNEDKKEDKKEGKKENKNKSKKEDKESKEEVKEENKEERGKEDMKEKDKETKEDENKKENTVLDNSPIEVEEEVIKTESKKQMQEENAPADMAYKDNSDLQENEHTDSAVLQEEEFSEAIESKEANEQAESVEAANAKETEALKKPKRKLSDKIAVQENEKISEVERKILSIQQATQQLSQSYTQIVNARPAAPPIPNKDQPRPPLSQEQPKAAEAKKTEKKPAAKPKKPRAAAIPAHIEEAITDYSKYYKTFADVFNGYVIDAKKFNLHAAIQDSCTVYKMYNSLFDDKMLFQFAFDASPLERAALDYMMYSQSNEAIEKKEINERVLDDKNHNVEAVKKAMLQSKLQEKFRRLKEKNFITEESSESSKQIEREVASLIDINRKPTLLYRVVKSREEVYDIVTKAFARKMQWNEMPHGVSLKHTWNFLWTWSKPNVDFTRLLVWQKVNHFPGAKNLARKDYLKRHIERCQNLGQRARQQFSFTPKTYLLPNEYIEMVSAFSKAEMEGERYNYWIMKPCANSRGRGISVFNSVSAISYGEPMIVQEYLKNPLLLNGFKFDMRIYVVVTSFNPLEAFVHREGFARLSTVRFSLDPEQIANRFVHLTNSSVQEHSRTKKQAPDAKFSGTKISLEQLKSQLYTQGIEFGDIWRQVTEIVVKSLAACQIDIPYNPCCFELFGYDVIIDSNLKCWLIEVNSSPSLGILNLLDDIVKIKLTDDLIDLVDALDFDRKRLLEVLSRRLKEVNSVTAATGAQAAKLLNRDLTYILNGQEPREYGEMPKFMGGFERVAPSSFSDKIIKLVGGQKMFGKRPT